MSERCVLQHHAADLSRIWSTAALEGAPAVNSLPEPRALPFTEQCGKRFEPPPAGGRGSQIHGPRAQRPRRPPTVGGNASARWIDLPSPGGAGPQPRSPGHIVHETGRLRDRRNAIGAPRGQPRSPPCGTGAQSSTTSIPSSAGSQSSSFRRERTSSLMCVRMTRFAPISSR